MKTQLKKTFLPIVMSLSLFVLSHYAQAEDVDSKAGLSNPEVVKQLSTILSPQDYTEFKANLIEYSGAYKSKSGTLFYEAKRQLNEGAPASVVVISPDGFYYIAYKSDKNQYINYITNDGKCSAEPHDFIKVFAGQYGSPEIKLVKSMMTQSTNHDCSAIYGNVQVKKKFPYTCSRNSCRKKYSLSRRKYLGKIHR